MKTVLKLTVAAAALVGLSACDMLGLNKAESGNGSAAANVTSNAAETNASADAGNASGGKPAGGDGAMTASTPFNGQVTTAFLVGRWTDNGDCNNVVEFRTDGTFEAPGGGSGMWALNGDRLTFQGSSTVSARVAAPDANTIMLTHDDGSLGRSTRC